MLGGVALRQQQHNRLRNIECSPVTVSSYPCGSAAAFVIFTMVALCWHVILSRSLFLTFSSAAREDVSVEKSVTSRHIRLSLNRLSLCFNPFIFYRFLTELFDYCHGQIQNIMSEFINAF